MVREPRGPREHACLVALDLILELLEFAVIADMVVEDCRERKVRLAGAACLAGAALGCRSGRCWEPTTKSSTSLNCRRLCNSRHARARGCCGWSRRYFHRLAILTVDESGTGELHRPTRMQ